MLKAMYHLFLDVSGQADKAGAIARNADDEVLMFFWMRQGIAQRLGCEAVHLDLQPALGKISLQRSLECVTFAGVRRAARVQGDIKRLPPHSENKPTVSIVETNSSARFVKSSGWSSAMK